MISTRAHEPAIAVESNPMGRDRAAESSTPTRGAACARVLLFAWVVVPVLVALLGSVALAQQGKPAPPVAKTHPTGRPAAPSKKGTSADSAASPGGAVAASAPPSGGAGGDAGVSEFKTLDGGTRVFKFTELDIEGRLKSPQLVYFLRRVRAEFAAGDLGHRSFMREMSETRKESSF